MKKLKKGFCSAVPSIFAYRGAWRRKMFALAKQLERNEKFVLGGVQKSKIRGTTEQKNKNHVKQ